jgi:hypothetical protein
MHTFYQCPVSMHVLLVHVDMIAHNYPPVHFKHERTDHAKTPLLRIVIQSKRLT